MMLLNFIFDSLIIRFVQLNNVIRFAFMKSTSYCSRFPKIKRNILVEGSSLCKQYGEGSHDKL